MRRRGCCRFLGCISRHSRKADKVWPVRPVNGIHRVVDRCVQDCKAPRRMHCNRLRSRRSDDRKECSIPLNNGVHLLNRGVVCTLMLAIRRSIRTKVKIERPAHSRANTVRILDISGFLSFLDKTVAVHAVGQTESGAPILIVLIGIGVLALSFCAPRTTSVTIRMLCSH